MLGKQNAGTVKELFGLTGNPNGNNGSARGTIHFQSPEYGQRQFEVSGRQVELKGRKALHCTFVDITERTTHLANLSQSEENLRLVVENSPDCIAVLENDRILFANRSFLNLLGYSDQGEMPASGFAGTVARKDRTRVMESLQVEALRSASNHIEYTGQHKACTPVDIEAELVPGRWGGNKVAILYARDFSYARTENIRRRSATEAFELLLDLDLALTGTLELSELLHEGLRSLLHGLHCEFGAVQLLDRDGKTLIRSHQ
jgi:PAS domain S-box-containing protein